MPTSSSARSRTSCTAKLAKRNVDVRFLDKGDVQKIGGDKVKQVIKVRNGIETEQAKKITRLIKDSKLKVQAAIQGDAVRVTGAKRDDLQAAMALIRKEIADLPAVLRQLPGLSRCKASRRCAGAGGAAGRTARCARSRWRCRACWATRPC